MMISIDDPNDPRIGAYRDVRERDLVGRDGQFIAEGEVVLRVLAGSALARPLSLLIARNRVEKLRPILERLPTDTPVYVAAQEVLDGIAGFPLHRGILALGERTEQPIASALLGRLGSSALVVALFGIGNHDNMGGAFRNAAAFGADAVLLDATCCDPLYRKAIRVSVGGTLATPFARLAPGEDAVALLSAAGFEIFALSPSGSLDLREAPRPARAAVLLGAEGPGLPADVMARTTTVRIPMAADFDSLNVATTCGIALHHFARGG